MGHQMLPMEALWSCHYFELGQGSIGGPLF